jgi:uncharacterized 2Fe-2S/4Fe-4S cluster protein (DUF4445 family)
MRVDFEPIGRRVDVRPGTSLLEAAQQAGIDLIAVCGGGGTCGTCRVRLISGGVTPISEDEKLFLSEEELSSGVRLGCQAVPLTDVRIDIPPQSLTAPQRTQVEGVEGEISLDPTTIGIDLDLDPPSSYDLRADAARVRDALLACGTSQVVVGHPVLEDISERLRSLNWSVRCAITRSGQADTLTAILPKNAKIAGLAVDVGTTKLAAYLVDLGTGKTLGRLGAMNPQIAYGEDVVARIAYCNQKSDGRQVLQNRLMTTLNEMLEQLCSEAGITTEQVVSAVVVGNTAMHHLFSGLPVSQLGASPYLAAESEAMEICASSIGLKIASGAQVYLPPNIAGYVGADHVSMLLATDAWHSSANVLSMDIGTNTEITLTTGGKLYACSCASGPAFEGAHIHQGMRAAPGAIERVQIRAGNNYLHTISNQPPVGICGSGILDAVAEMLGAGIIDMRGALNKKHPSVRNTNRQAEFLLVSAKQSGNGQDIVITREDVHQIQLAKAAIRAGVDVLLKEAGLKEEEIDEFIIAGAFGTYLDLENAVRIGMFPHLPMDRFKQVGNAAGTGARQMLISGQKRQEAVALSRMENYIELTTYPDFTDIYINEMFFQS